MRWDKIRGGQNSDCYDYLTHIITHILLSCHALRVRVNGLF